MDRRDARLDAMGPGGGMDRARVRLRVDAHRSATGAWDASGDVRRDARDGRGAPRELADADAEKSADRV